MPISVYQSAVDQITRAQSYLSSFVPLKELHEGITTQAPAKQTLVLEQLKEIFGLRHWVKVSVASNDEFQKIQKVALGIKNETIPTPQVDTRLPISETSKLSKILLGTLTALSIGAIGYYMHQHFWASHTVVVEPYIPTVEDVIFEDASKIPDVVDQLENEVLKHVSSTEAVPVDQSVNPVMSVLALGLIGVFVLASQCRSKGYIERSVFRTVFDAVAGPHDGREVNLDSILLENGYDADSERSDGDDKSPETTPPLIKTEDPLDVLSGTGNALVLAGGSSRALVTTPSSLQSTEVAVPAKKADNGPVTEWDEIIKTEKNFQSDLETIIALREHLSIDLINKLTKDCLTSHRQTLVAQALTEMIHRQHVDTILQMSKKLVSELERVRKQILQDETKPSEFAKALADFVKCFNIIELQDFESFARYIGYYSSYQIDHDTEKQNFFNALDKAFKTASEDKKVRDVYQTRLDDEDPSTEKVKANFISTMLASPGGKALLISPMQRVSKYSLLITSILKRISELDKTSPNNPIIQNALEDVKQFQAYFKVAAQEEVNALTGVTRIKMMVEEAKTGGILQSKFLELKSKKTLKKSSKEVILKNESDALDYIFKCLEAEIAIAGILIKKSGKAERALHRLLDVEKILDDLQNLPMMKKTISENYGDKISAVQTNINLIKAFAETLQSR